MKPLILLTPRKTEEPLYTLRPNYCHAVEAAGGLPLIAPWSNAEDFAALADGLLLTGGADIDPAFFGEENRAANGCDRECDQAEFELFKAFARRKKPILGICRGAQVINVALGGTLFQDLQEAGVPRSLHETAPQQHPVRAKDGSLLARLFGKEFETNSFHHQAVKTCGEGLLPTVTAADGIIEGLEHQALPILAVQWHPERMLEEMLPLFTYFIEQCKK